MNQHDGPACAFDHKVQVSTVNIDESRFGVGVVMSYTRSDIPLFESAGDAHVIDSEDSSNG